MSWTSMNGVMRWECKEDGMRSLRAGARYLGSVWMSPRGWRWESWRGVEGWELSEAEAKSKVEKAA